MNIHNICVWNATMLLTIVAVVLTAVLCAPVGPDPPFTEQNYDDTSGEHEYVGREITNFIISEKRVRSKNGELNKRKDVQNAMIEGSSNNNYVKHYRRFLRGTREAGAANGVDSEDDSFSFADGNEIGSPAFLDQIFRVIDEQLLEKEKSILDGKPDGRIVSTVDPLGKIDDKTLHGKDKGNSFSFADGNEIGSTAFLDQIFRVIDEQLLEKEKSILDGKPDGRIGSTVDPLGKSDDKTHPGKDKGKIDATRQFRRETIPEIDLDIEHNIFKQFSREQLSLKALYEKKGGVCTQIEGYRRSPLYVIATCPVFHQNTDVKHLCEYVSPALNSHHHENIIEVTATPVQDMHGFVYRNLYCAQCQGAKGVQAWSTKLLCDDMQQLVLSDGHHDVTFLAELVDKNQGCHRVVAPVCIRGIHECPVSEVTKVRQSGHETRQGDNSKTDYSPFPLSFTILMNFGFDGKTHILFSTLPTDQLGQNRCNPNEMYDPVNDKCRAISCTEGYRLVDGSCQKTSTYEYDATGQDFDFSHTEEPLQVILILRNISYGTAYMLTLPGMDVLVTESLANEVNISTDRIQNLTLSILNNTEIENGTLHNELEIRRFSTNAPSKSFHTPSMDQAQPADAVSDKSPDKSVPIKLDSSIKGTKGWHAYKQGEIFDDTGQPTNYSDIFTTDVNVLNHKHIGKDSEYKNYIHVGNDMAKETNDTLEKEQKHSGTTSLGTTKDWMNEILPDCSVKIEFILKQAVRNTTITEKSAKGVVDIMNNLIRNNSFMFSLNGTDFQIQHLENAPNPASLDEFCTKGHKSFYDKDEFTFLSLSNELSNTTHPIIYINETGRIYRSGEYDLTFSFDGNMNYLNRTMILVVSFVIVCDTPKIRNELCPRIVLGEEEYKKLDNFYIYFANQTYNLSEYEYNNAKDETVRICAPDWSASQLMYNEGQWVLACGDDMMKMVVAESYLTFILGLISLLSMLTVLITYSMFERLRNLPGVNTMNLTLSLFLGELVFILSGWIQPHVSWLCSGVGMLLHYLFLASFFWMNVMSYDVFRTFAKKCILRRVREKKKYLPRYVLYAWGSPLFIVAICAFLDFSNAIDGVAIGYGSLPFSTDTDKANRSYERANADITSPESNEEIMYKIGCWIQKPVAAMIAFGGPMMCVLLSNGYMFTRTIICIRASTKSTRNSFRRASLNHMAGRDDVMLYVRMSTVMGFTWIFGLASSIVSAFAGAPSRVMCITLYLLGILFIVLNCSQGIFIFFAFVCNRRVFALYRGLLHRLKDNRKRPLSLSTSRGTIYSVNNTSLSTLSNVPEQ